METKRVRDDHDSPSTTSSTIDTKAVVDSLNRILEMELAGAVMYTHFSFMVVGHDRMQFVKWLEGQADEAITHAKTAGSLVSQLGSHPSLEIAALTDAPQHDINGMLRHRRLVFEKSTLAHYVTLLAVDKRQKHHARGIRAATRLSRDTTHRRSGKDAATARRRPEPRCGLTHTEHRDFSFCRRRSILASKLSAMSFVQRNRSTSSSVGIRRDRRVV